MRKITFLLAVMAVFWTVSTNNAYALSTEPTTQASALTATPSQQSVSLAFTAGNGTKSLIVYSTTSLAHVTTVAPTDGVTYSPGCLLASGLRVGFVTYTNASVANTVVIAGLTVGTTYYYAIYSFNDANGTLVNSTPCGSENYKTGSPLTGSFTTTSYTTTAMKSGVAGTWETATNWLVSPDWTASATVPASTTPTTVSASYEPIVTTVTVPNINPSGIYMENGAKLGMKPGGATTYGTTPLEFFKNVTIDGNGGAITLKPYTSSSASAGKLHYRPAITNASSVTYELNTAGTFSNANWRTSFDPTMLPDNCQLNVTSAVGTTAGTAGFALVRDEILTNTKLNLGDGVRLLKQSNANVSSPYSTFVVGELSGSANSTVEGNFVSGRLLNYYIGGLNTDATFNGKFKNYIAGDLLNIYKKGTGAWTLTADSHLGFLTGLFNVDAGKVILTATGRLGGTSVPVTVVSGATLQGSYGATVDGVTTVNGSLTGSMAFNSALTLGAASTTNLSVNGYTTVGTDYDYINATGQTVTYGGTLNITVNSLAGMTNIQLIKAGTYAGSFATVNIKDGSGNTPVGFSFNQATGTLVYSLAIPTTQPTALNLTNVLQTSLTATWTVGDGAKNLVLYSTNPDVATAYPPQDNTTYTVGGTTHAGYIVGAINSGNTVSITGLSPYTKYYFAVFGFNDYNTTGSERYLRATPAEANATTPANSAATDYFKSVGTGNWTATATWNSSADNSSWHLANLTPDGSATGVLISTGNTVTVTANPTSTAVSLADGSTLAIGANNITVPAASFNGTTAVIDAASYYGVKVSGLSATNGNKVTLKGSYNTTNGNIPCFFDASVGTLDSGSELILNGTGNTENKFGLTVPNPTVPAANTYYPNYLANTTVNLKGKALFYLDFNHPANTVVNIGALAGESTAKLGWGKSAGTDRAITWSVGASNLSTEFAGTITNLGGYKGSGSMYIGDYTNLTKVGTGTLTLSGTSTGYNGNLTINGGELIISAAGTIVGNNQAITPKTNAVTVSGTNTKLTVNGSLTATTITIGSDGTLQGTGSITATTLNVNSGGSVATTTFPTVSAVNVTTNATTSGTLTLQNGSTIPSLTIISTSAPTVGTTIQVVTAVDPSTIVYTNAPVVPLGYSYNQATGVLTYNGTTVSSDITLTTIPSNGVVTVNSGLLTIDQNAALNSLTVAPGAKVTLASGRTFSATSVSLQSSPSGTATFVDADATGKTITATVEQYLPTGRNWYVGVPVTDAASVPYTALTAAGASSVSYWDEANGAWVNNSTANLVRGRGYIAVSSAVSTPTNISFSGTLNTGNVTVKLTRTVGKTKEGFNLIANPYPSYLNPCALISSLSDSIETTIWYRTKVGSYKFETVNAASGKGTGGVTGFIPPMQAFWMRVKPNATNAALNNGATLTFTNAMRYHANPTQSDTTVATTALKSPKLVKDKNIRLTVSNGVNSDETVIYTNANASNGYDMYDSNKMTNDNVAIPELYTVLGNENLVINGFNQLPVDVEIPLGFKTGQTNSFIIKATQIQNLDEGTSLILIDKVLNTEYQLTEGTDYAFSSDITNTTSRFSVVLKANGVTTGTELRKAESGLSAYCNAKKQIVVSGVSADDNIGVYNSLGQKVMEKRYTSQPMTLQGNFTPGVYLVVVNNAIQKVLVK